MKSKPFTALFVNPLVALMLIAGITLVVYSDTYGVPLVFDGQYQIEKKEKIRDLKNYLSLKGFKSQRPLVEFSFALNYRLGKLNPFGFHLVNIFIHITSGILAYFLALNVFRRLSFFQKERSGLPVSSKHRCARNKRSGMSVPSTENLQGMSFSSSTIPFMALFVSLIFVVHPIQTQAVTYVVQRYASMSAMFYLLSVLLYVQARNLQLNMKGLGQNGNPESKLLPQKTNTSFSAFSPGILICFVFSFLSGILAVLSKENAATLPGVILLVEYFLFDRSWRGWKKKLIWLVPAGVFLGFLALYLFSSLRGLRFENLLEDISILTRETKTVDRWSYFCTQFSVFVHYLRLLFCPVGQNLDYMYPMKTGFFDGFTPLAFIVVLVVLGLGFWSIRKKPAISFGVFWIFITLSVESSIFPISDAMIEHRLYLPVFGFAISVVFLVFDLLASRRGWVIFFLAMGIAVLGTATYLRNQVWKDPLVLWTDVVSKSPLNYRANNNLGTLLNDRGDSEGAVREFTKALLIKPDFGNARNNLGNAFLRQGKYDEAIVQLREALRLKPNSIGTHNNMGIVLSIRGNFETAIRHFNKALAINPRSAETYTNLGNCFLAQGKPNQAVQYFQKALKLNPGLSEARQGLKQAHETN